MTAIAISPITRLYPIDDGKLKAAGVTYVAINEPKLIVAIAGNTVEIEISQDWEQVRIHLVEQSRHYLTDNDTLARLERYVGTLYAKNADLITQIVDRIDKAGAGDNKKAKEALVLAEKHSKELFLNEYGRAYASIYVNDGDHVEIHPMNEGKFRRWISGLYFKETNKILGDGDIDKVIRILEGKAEFEGNVKKHKLDLRVRGYNSGTGEGVDNLDSGTTAQATYDEDDEDIENFTEIYYDLTNRNWESVKITPTGWEIVRDPPILFRRHGSEQPQIYPSRQYPADILDRYIGLQNIKNENHKFLKKVWIIACFWPNTTPKPIMMVNAPQGSAKSTMSDMDRDLVDPNVVRTSSLPKEDFNLKQHLAHNYLSSFDNVSYISDEHSDTLCRAVTGGRDTKRKLYEDDEDIIYTYKRIVSLNGIVNAATKPDLLDRGLIIELDSISKQQRELLKRIRRKFKVIKPLLVGFCLDVISEVMAEREKWRNSDPDYYGLKEVVDENGGVPRLADYAILGEQIATIVARKEGKPYRQGDFLKEWDSNYNNLNVEALKSSLLAEALITFLTDREASKKESAWEGSATQLLSELNYFISQHNEITIDIHSKAWPNDPTRLGRELARIKTNLEPLGIKVESKRTHVNIIHTITKFPISATQPTQPTQTEKSRSDESQISVATHVAEPTAQPTRLLTRPEGEKEHRNGDSVGSVGSVGKNRILGEGLVYTMIKIAMRDEAGGTASNKDYFLGKVFVRHLMTQPAIRMTEDEAKQTLRALVDDGTLEELGDDQYRPVQMQKIQKELNWW